MSWQFFFVSKQFYKTYLTKDKTMIKFMTDEDLGGVVSNVTPIYKTIDLATVLQVNPTVSPEIFNQFLRETCNSKFGFLFGFRFKTNDESIQHKLFSVVFVPKIKSALMRQETKGASYWEIWQHISTTEKRVLSAEAAKHVYGFDVEKFYDSDVFEDWVEKLIKIVSNHIRTQFVPYIDSIRDTVEKNEARRLLKTMTDACALAAATIRRDATSYQQIDFDRQKKDKSL